MSAAFFEQLGIPEPDFHLGVGSGSHADQTARIMQAFEPVLCESRPDWLVLVGDVNSTLACALVAAKLKEELGCRIAHVEAGLRSRDWTMPEEVNRVVTDRLSDLLLTTSAGSGGEPRRRGDRRRPGRLRRQRDDRHASAGVATRPRGRIGAQDRGGGCPVRGRHPPPTLERGRARPAAGDPGRPGACRGDGSGRVSAPPPDAGSRRVLRPPVDAGVAIVYRAARLSRHARPHGRCGRCLHGLRRRAGGDHRAGCPLRHAAGDDGEACHGGAGHQPHDRLAPDAAIGSRRRTRHGGPAERRASARLPRKGGTGRRRSGSSRALRARSARGGRDLRRLCSEGTRL